MHDEPTRAADEHRETDDQIEAMRVALRQTTERLRELRSQPIDADVGEELRRLWYRGTRLGRRLERLEHDGLLELGAHRTLAPTDVLVEAMDEIADECEHRHVQITTQIAGALPRIWIDREQLLECLRCALDEALATMVDGGQLGCAARATREHVLVTISWSPEIRDTPGDPLARGLLTRLAHQMGVALAVATTAEGSAINLRLPRRDMRSATQQGEMPARRWVFPTPTAA